ncbi:cytotoxic and regulatory T-cell molecule isoform X2 [Genypterus blacodes]|uniref:cytotoxic and regulatory T-cell molecule isoform X2 n=1 Tax=Genypterus blacodes TaxID=154954 RepID=UPI003F7644DE
MEVKLQLSLFMFFIPVSLALWQRVTVMEGRILTLTCPLRKAHRNHVEWRNPEHNIMFFNRQQALQDRRYSIINLSTSQFTISISKVSFKDGGNYTCSEYHHSHTNENIVEVTVLGTPKMEVVQHDGKYVIKCTAEGNHHPPQISWSLGQDESEVTHQEDIRHEVGIHKYTSEDKMQIQASDNGLVVKCLVRHPALHSNILMDFVRIGRSSRRSLLRTSTSSPTTAQPQRSTEVSRTTAGWLNDKTTPTPLTTHLFRPSSENSTKLNNPSDEPKTITASTGLHLNTTTPSHQSTDGSTHTWNSTVSNTSSTTGWTISTVTENSPGYNSSEGNRNIGDASEPERRKGNTGKATLLVLLVTCLIVGLLVVVIFFSIKLRRAHLIWKRENEESEPSSESSKSKSSQEEKQAQGQRRKGLFNTAFTQYVAEAPTEIPTPSTSSSAPEAAESVKEEKTFEAHLSTTTATNNMKETEL